MITPQHIPEQTSNGGNLYSEPEPELDPPSDHIYASINGAATTDDGDNVFISESDLNASTTTGDENLIADSVASKTNESENLLYENVDERDKSNSGDINKNNDGENENDRDKDDRDDINNADTAIDLNGDGENPPSLFDLSVKERVVYYDSLVGTDGEKRSLDDTDNSFSSIGNNISIRRKSSVSETNKLRRKSTGSVNHVNSCRLSSNILCIINKMYDPDTSMPDLPEEDEGYASIHDCIQMNSDKLNGTVPDSNNNEEEGHDESVSVDMGVW